MSLKKEKLKFLPFRLINRVFPKQKSIWLFGSWFGDKYSDSPRYLFEYINLEKKDIRPIWITKDNGVYTFLKERNFEVYMFDSFLGIYYTLRASICFVTQSHIDINKYIKVPKIYNLWHGNPLKKIGNDVSKNKKKYLKDYYLSASSEIEKENLFSAFNVFKENIFITGLPRNSAFKKKKSNIKKIIYMPTHREDSKSNVVDVISKDIEKVNAFLKSKKVELYLRLHYYDLEKFNNLELNYTNIKKYDLDEDIYQSINNFDLLITDYSSIYLDYLLSDKPIIFFPYDLDNYISKDREFYYDYDDVTPGPKCFDWNQIIIEVDKFINDKSYYKNDLLKTKNKFHIYQDDKYSERVYLEAKRILGLDNE